MGAPQVTQKAAPPAKEERGCLTDLPPTIEGTTLVINTDRSGLQQQAAAAALLSDLIHTAIGNGARTMPSINIGQRGSISLNLHYEDKPIMADLSAWGLVFGPYETRAVAFSNGDRWYTSDVADITISDVNVHFAVSYPYTPIGLKVVR